MVDHVRTLLINNGSSRSCRKVSDAPADAVLSLFGLSGASSDVSLDTALVDMVLPLAMAPDLSPLRRFFDGRTTPPPRDPSVYRHLYSACTDDRCVGLSMTGLYDRVLGDAGRPRVYALFSSDDPAVRDVLTEYRRAVNSHDAAYSLGAVLLSCAYRRLVLQ